jgi:hypothetical protein
MKKIVVMTVLLVLSVAVFAQEPEPKLDLIALVKNPNWINILLAVVSTVFAGYFVFTRIKLKQAGEFFLMAYEYTDDKVLDKVERQNLLNQFLVIIGKRKAEVAQKKIIEQGGAKEVIRSKTKIKIKTRRKQ